MEVFDKYLEQVKEITNTKSRDGSSYFYKDMRREFEYDLFKTSPRKVWGIVVGVIRNSIIIDKNILLSTGNREISDRYMSKLRMLDKVTPL